MKTRFKLIILSLFVTSSIFAQELTVTGEVTSTDDGMPLPGVNVIVVGTNRGVSTDFDGLYTIKVSKGEILEFSSVGLKTQRITVENQSSINVSLQTDIAALDEVVIVGYGTQKKADLTGSITTVKSEVIEKTPSANVMQALQGQVSGVQIVSTGSPGDSPTVRLRGLGTYSGSGSPLYVVDGMFYSNIDFLNTKDIESLTILKDASSSAIYGVRAANGVVIIKTKTGILSQKPQFEYDGYAGVQYAQNVLKLANAEQFTTMAYESGSQPDVSFVLNAMQRYGRSRVNPNVPDVNTDWYKEILRPGYISSHSIGATGGAENVSYSVGANYFAQEGILDMKNEYERFNIRSKVDVKLSERFKIGTNMVFSNATKYNAENAAFFQAYYAVPIMPVIDPVMDEIMEDAYPDHYSNAQVLGYRGTQNPFPVMRYNENQLKLRKLLTNIYFEIDLIPERLTFKSSYNHDFSAFDERYVRLPFNLGNNVDRTSSITKAQNTFSNQIWDNILTYNNSFGDHNLTVMAGTSYRDEAGHSFSATGENISGIDLESSWYLDFAEDESFSGNVSDSGGRLYGISYFARAAYNYKDKYLLYGTIRADGSSKFTLDPWGYFPSVGAGWVLTQEDFMKNNGVFDFLKLRASWGKLGNDAVPASSGSNTITVISTDIGDIPTTGIISTSTFSNNTWEVIEEMNFGTNFNMFDNRLSVDADYYIRDTKNAIMPVFVPIINTTINRNSGEIRNQGFEIALNWSNTISDDFRYTVGANFTTLKNETTSLSDPRGYIDAGTAEFRQRTIVGEPLQAFYGYQTEGVYQNQAQVDADPIAVANNLVPGDLIYKDTNNDGVINDDDRVILGSYLPSFMYGGNIGISYKAFDFSVNFYGQTGNKILNRKRGEIIFTNDTNMDADLAINRWHGEGTSNEYPSSAGLRKGWNQKLSNFWVEDGAFFRIQNIQLAYTLKGEKMFGKNMPETKFILTADRPFTFFNYNGFDPEVPNGVDRQTYPIPGVYTFGINVKI